MTIVNFPKKENDPLVLVCQHCNCMTFFVNENQTISCANCGLETENPKGEWEWRKRLPVPPETPNNTAGVGKVTNMGSPEAARSAVLGDIRRWHENDEVELLVGYRVDGMGRHWAGIYTEEDRQHVLERLRDIVQNVEKMDIFVKEDNNG